MWRYSIWFLVFSTLGIATGYYSLLGWRIWVLCGPDLYSCLFVLELLMWTSNIEHCCLIRRVNNGTLFSPQGVVAPRFYAHLPVLWIKILYLLHATVYRCLTLRTYRVWFAFWNLWNVSQVHKQLNAHTAVVEEAKQDSESCSKRIKELKETCESRYASYLQPYVLCCFSVISILDNPWQS